MIKHTVFAGLVMASVFSGMAALSYGDDKASEKKVTLKLDYPEPVPGRTPKKSNSSNLNRNYKHPVILVPEGAKNIAKDKPVSGSDSNPQIGELELVTDDDRSCTDGSYVELAPGKQWVQIDLEQEAEIYAIAVWHWHRDLVENIYYDVVIQVSNDPDFIDSVQTVFNNDHDNSSGLGKGNDKEYLDTNKGLLIDTGKIKGRYIRLYSNGSTESDLNHYGEVEVYGKRK